MKPATNGKSSKSIFATLFLAMSVSMTMTACGIGLDDSLGPNPDRVIKNERNLREYEAIKGVYEGRLANAGTGLQPFPVKMSIYWDKEQDAPDSDLQNAERVILRGRLQRLDFVGESDNLILTGTYNSATAQIELVPDTKVQLASCNAGGRSPISIRGVVNGSTATLTVNRDGRVWGTVQAQLTSKEVKSQAATDEQADFERLRESYRTIQGQYSGNLKRTNSAGGRTNEDITFNLFVVESREGNDARGEPCFRPRLTARFLRERSGEFDDVTMNDVRYYPETREINARAGSSGGGGAGGGGSGGATNNAGNDTPYPGAPNTGTTNPGGGAPSTTPAFELRGNVGDGITGRLYTGRGFWGEVNLTRGSTEAPAPEDGEESLERERRMRSYRDLVGVYTGRVTPTTGEVPWPVEVSIYIVEEESGRSSSGEPRYLPALRGRYRRPDFTSGIGDRFMLIRYYTEGGRRRVAMSSLTTIVGPIPGAGVFSITGSVQDNTISGSLSDHRGPQGDIRMTKVR